MERQFGKALASVRVTAHKSVAMAQRMAKLWELTMAIESAKTTAPE